MESAHEQSILRITRKNKKKQQSCIREQTKLQDIAENFK